MNKNVWTLKSKFPQLTHSLLHASIRLSIYCLSFVLHYSIITNLHISLLIWFKLRAFASISQSFKESQFVELWCLQSYIFRLYLQAGGIRQRSKANERARIHSQPRATSLLRQSHLETLPFCGQDPFDREVSAIPSRVHPSHSWRSSKPHRVCHTPRRDHPLMIDSLLKLQQGPMFQVRFL